VRLSLTVSQDNSTTPSRAAVAVTPANGSGGAPPVVGGAAPEGDDDFDADELLELEETTTSQLPVQHGQASQAGPAGPGPNAADSAAGALALVLAGATVGPPVPRRRAENEAARGQAGPVRPRQGR
jgi:hypothetical protein